MQSVLIHLVAFWNVVVMNCIQPVNWEQCAPVHRWLLPEVVEGYKLWSGQTKPYENEKVFLESQSDR
jgi:hypothetical protein